MPLHCRSKIMDEAITDENEKQKHLKAGDKVQDLKIKVQDERYMDKAINQIATLLTNGFSIHYKNDNYRA